MKRYFTILGLLGGLLFPQLLQASTSSETNDTVTVGFRQSSIVIDMNYRDNGVHFDSITAEIKRHITDKGDVEFESVDIFGGASPEGTARFNRYLSEYRAEAIRKELSRYVELPDTIISLTLVGSDWRGLKALVMADEGVPGRDEIIAALDSIIVMASENPEYDERMQREFLTELRRIDSGRTYEYMYRKLFPQLRSSGIILRYPQILSARGEVTPLGYYDITATPEWGELDLEPLLTPMASPCKPFYMGLKTNLLYDAAALPSIGAEFYVGKNWSIVGNWTYGWWDKDNRHRYWRAYGGDIAVRKWLGRRAHEKPLTGHHIGLYAGVITYDFEFGSTGYMGGLPGRTLWDRCNYMAGIEYGYSLPIARRLNLDFTIGLGYLGGKVIKYEPDDKFYRWEKTKHLNWFGPTKLEVSLVWLIGCDNFNRPAKKGGAR